MILSSFLFVSPKSSFDLSINAAILFGSKSSFFSNSDTCLTLESSVLGFAIASYNLGLFYYAGYESFKRDLNKAKENWKKCYIQHPKADPQLNLDDISKEIDSFAAKPTEEMTLLKSTFLANLKKTIRN